jgi:hypothetical protein
MSGEEDSSDRGLLSTATQLLTLYVAYVFVSGWAFVDYSKGSLLKIPDEVLLAFEIVSE